MNKLNRTITLSSLIILFLSFHPGCSRNDEIRVDKIPKGRSDVASLRQDQRPPINSSLASVSPSTRMVVAVFENPEATWFFKISGPTEQVTATEKSWREFLKTISFDGNTPSWDMPDGWADAAKKPMRYATLKIGTASPPLEMAISSLSPNQDLLLNANRWLGQIGLPPTNAESLNTTIVPIENENANYLLFDKTGQGSGKMTPPFAGAAQPPRQPVPPPVRAQEQDVSFETPKGWNIGTTNSMVKVRLTKEADGEKAQITVIEMPASANTWEPNVQRWQQQVGLGKLSVSEVTDRVSDISVGGVSGKIVNLIDMKSESDTGTIAAMIKRGDSAWFLKLSGDKSLVDANRESFESFLNTLQFK